jgi:eukaryotic-like serine/threonine-protein kinase
VVALRPVAPDSDRVGDIIAERYEIRGVIGRGGQGLVYRAHDRWTEHMVALKVLGSKEARTPQMGQRMIREQQALSALKGTAAVELRDVCRSNDGELCLVMELLSGKDLDEYLYDIEDRDERLSLFRIAEIFDPIVDTLEVAHAAGIVHRDLKPANVFLLDGGGVRLLDFGLARVRSAAPLTAAGTVMGSPSFMAPEAWKGRPELVDHRADVYSLGVILFRVLTAELPFAGESLYEKFLGSTQGTRPSLLALRPDLPRDADEWLAQALAIDRDERFSNVRALWNAFCATFDVEPPRRGKPVVSFWSAAKNAVKRLARGEEARTPAADPKRQEEPSFNREALLRSVSPAQAEPTVSIEPSPPVPRPPVARRKPPRPRTARSRPATDQTIELTDADLSEAPSGHRAPGAETTLELSGTDLVVAEHTLPVIEAPQAQALGDEKPAPDQKKRARGRKRKQRKKERKKKRKR